MGKTWGDHHRERQAARGTPTKWNARKAKASGAGMEKVCKCGGTGRLHGHKCPHCFTNDTPGYR